MKKNKKRIAIIIGTVIVVVLIVILIVVSIVINNNENASRETSNKQTEEKEKENVEDNVLTDKFSKEHTLMCNRFFNFNDEATGLDSAYINIYVFYNDNNDSEFYTDVYYSYNYETYMQALADYQNKISGHEDWEYDVEEDLADGTGEITIQANSVLMTELNVSDYVSELRETGLTCEQIS